jgi:uncharacterized glyoxalase superfamily protein PhnB
MRVKKAVPYVQVRNLNHSLEFHTSVLGYELREVMKFEDGEPFWAHLNNGESSLMLSSLPVHDRPRLTWVYADDTDAAYQECIAAGHQPLTCPKDEEHGCREFVVIDDSGEVYVIAHQLRNTDER